MIEVDPGEVVAFGLPLSWVLGLMVLIGGIAAVVLAPRFLGLGGRAAQGDHVIDTRRDAGPSFGGSGTDRAHLSGIAPAVPTPAPPEGIGRPMLFEPQKGASADDMLTIESDLDRSTEEGTADRADEDSSEEAKT